MSITFESVTRTRTSSWSVHSFRLILLSSILLFAFATAAHGQLVVLVQNGGFETPAIQNNSSVFQPTGTPWTFGNNSGIINNSSAWQAGGVPAPQGAQVGYIQSPHPSAGQVGFLAQNILLPATTAFRLNYFLAGRIGPSGEGGQLPFDVFIDNTIIGTDNSTTAMPFTARSIIFNATAGPHQFRIVGRRPVPDPNVFQDNTAFLDAITITVVPEPSSLILGGAALIAMLGRISRTRLRRSLPL